MIVVLTLNFGSISIAVQGDHTWEAYSSNGRTYVMNALSKVCRSLEWKHLKN